MARIKTPKQQLVEKIISTREEQADYENSHQLESTIVMAFDATRNSVAIINNVATIVRNKTEIKVVESATELAEAYSKMLTA